MIDVRDTAAHHVAAYEKGFEGRFFSTTEAWPWTLIYKALEHYFPQINLPMPLPRGTNLLPVREYSKTRMNDLAVKERSVMKVLGDAVQELKLKQLIKPSYLDVAGFYIINTEGDFIMVDVKCSIESGRIVNTAQLSYVIGWVVNNKPTVIQLPSQALQFPSGAGLADYVLRAGPDVELSFCKCYTGSAALKVWGTINGNSVTGASYVTAIPYNAFAYTYVAVDGSDKVTISDGEGSTSIMFSNGSTHDTFTYDPIKRRFSYIDGDIAHRLYINVSAVNGLIIRSVQFNRNNPKGTGSTKIYCRTTKANQAPQGPVYGAASLAKFAGFYSLSLPFGIPFISIEGVTKVSSDGVTPENSIQIGVCLDGINCTVYSSFTFENNVLTLPNSELDPLIFYKKPTSTRLSTGQDNVPIYGNNFFSVVPQSAFGYQSLASNSTSTYNATLGIVSSNVVDNLTFTLDDTPEFDTSLYGYNAVQQAVVYDDFRLNFCYNPKKGVTCGVTKTEGGFSAVLYAYPS